MNHLKAELKSQPHPDFELHSFASLGRAVGYSRANIHELIADGKINLIASRLDKWCNILLVSKEEVARLFAMRLGHLRFKQETDQLRKQKIEEMKKEAAKLKKQREQRREANKRKKWAKALKRGEALIKKQIAQRGN